MDSNSPVGSFTLKFGPDPTYARIYDGAWKNSLPYYVIHRITSKPNAHGVFSALLRYSLSVCSNLRIDTYRDNTIMQHLLLQHGFEYCGIIYIANGDDRWAYQLTVNE